MRKLGRGSLPPAKEVSYSALLTGRYDCDFVEITGVVQRAFLSDPKTHQLFADVAIEGGVVRASFWDYETDDLTRFIDARVRLRTNVGSLFGQTEQLRGVSLLAERTRDIVVVDPPPDPFSLPLRPIRGIYKYSPGGEVNRRIRVRGVVIGQILGRPVEVTDFPTTSTLRYVSHVLYVKDGTSGARIETEQETLVRPGEMVEAAGFPAVTPGKPLLKNAVFRKVGAEGEPEPVPVSPQKALTPENDAELVRMQAQLLGVVTRPANRVLVLKVGAIVFDADLGLSAAGRRPRGGSAGKRRVRDGRLLLPARSAALLPAAAPLAAGRRARGRRGLVDLPPHRGHRGDRRPRGRGGRLLGDDDRAIGSARSTRPSSPSATGWPASCTTPSSRGWPESRCSSRRWGGASRPRP